MLKESSMYHLTDADFDQKVLRAKSPVVVNFTSSNSAPCARIEPVFCSVASQFEGRTEVYELDVDQNPHTARRYHVKAAPEVFVFQDGQPRWKFVGEKLVPKLEAFLRRSFPSN
jgi:thioredoxin 1